MLIPDQAHGTDVTFDGTGLLNQWIVSIHENLSKQFACHDIALRLPLSPPLKRTQDLPIGFGSGPPHEVPHFEGIPMGSALLEKVEWHTRLAGHNRVAMLLFHLGDNQLFGINVFKVREVLRRTPLERMPSAHELLAGTGDYRGQTIPVIDLGAALGYAPLRQVESAHMIVTEFSRSVQGFLVAEPQRIVHCSGESLVAPAAALGFGPRVNAVTRVDGALVAIVDVEHVLAQIDAAPDELSTRLVRDAGERTTGLRRALVADDSLIARRRIVKVLQQIGVECVVVQDGREALDRLLELADAPEAERVSLLVSDIEMPRMDGYALTRAVRETPALRSLKVLLHSSISGIFNEEMVKEVNADSFVAKFQPDLLAKAVMDLLPESVADVERT